jgi:hypothetical protein
MKERTMSPPRDMTELEVVKLLPEMLQVELLRAIQDTFALARALMSLIAKLPTRSRWIYDTSFGVNGSIYFVAGQTGRIELHRDGSHIMLGATAVGLGSSPVPGSVGRSQAWQDSWGKLFLGVDQADFEPTDFVGPCVALGGDAGLDGPGIVDAAAKGKNLGTYVSFLLLGASDQLRSSVSSYRAARARFLAELEHPKRWLDRIVEAAIPTKTPKLAYLVACMNVAAGNVLLQLAIKPFRGCLFMTGESQETAGFGASIVAGYVSLEAGAGAA